MRTLYVTTFNHAFWEKSAKLMIESFLKTQSDGDILICYEDFRFDCSLIEKSLQDLAKQKILSYDLRFSSFLRSWLRSNRSYIPLELGGTAIKSKDKLPYSRWNYRMSGWFRKIVALDYALTEFSNKYDVIIFIDADCEFKNTLKSSVIKDSFSSNDCFFHLGNVRKERGLGVETGLIGFKTNASGLKILKLWINKFKTNEFRDYDIWSDSYIFYTVINENNNLKAIDLASQDNENRKSYVISQGPFGDYIFHFKGRNKHK